MSPSHIAVIGAPMDLGAGRRGVDMGPSALRVAGLNEKLLRLGYEVEDLGNVLVDQPESAPVGHPKARYLPQIAHTCSRLAEMVWTPEQREVVRSLKTMIARFEDTRDLRLMGGYTAGTDAELDQAVTMVPRIYNALRQHPSVRPSADSFGELAQVLRGEHRGSCGKFRLRSMVGAGGQSQGKCDRHEGCEAF